jgi:transposase
MEVLVDRGAGIDVHKKSVTVCVMATEGRTVVRTIQRFGPFHRDLMALREWLVEQRVTHVAMEATGEYWKPLYEVLEGSFQLVVANAQHVKNVPGRKTDPEDAAWLARLLRHGLLRASFVPPRAIRELRDLTRLRRKTVDMISKVENRVRKVLEACGVKLGSVVSDLFGATGRAILNELAANRTDPAALAGLARGTLKQKRRNLELSLEGSFSEHDAALLAHQLAVHSQLEQRLQTIERQIDSRAQPYELLISRLDAIPGINRRAALDIIGEIGNDMSPWKDSSRFAAWAGLCPGNHESAGKRTRTSVRKGNPFLKTVLVQAATAAARAKGTYYQTRFRRFVRRHGYKRAIVALAHALLITIYHMVRKDEPYRELGGDWLEKHSAESKANALIRQLERLGYAIALRPVAEQ